MSKLEEFRKTNPQYKILTLDDPSFKEYGVLYTNDFNLDDVYKVMEKVPIPETGMKYIANIPELADTSPISKELPNVAIPHTEGEFVNARLIVPVALKHPIKFQNMIAPDESLEVKFLFMILNNDPEGQANVLAQIMGFLSTTPVEDLIRLFNLTSTKEIFDFMSENFKQE